MSAQPLAPHHPGDDEPTPARGVASVTPIPTARRPLTSVPAAPAEPRHAQQPPRQRNLLLVALYIFAALSLAATTAGGILTAVFGSGMHEQVRVAAWVGVVLAGHAFLMASTGVLCVHAVDGLIARQRAAQSDGVHRELDRLRDDIRTDAEASNRQVLAAVAEAQQYAAALHLQLQRAPRLVGASELAARLDRIEEHLEHSSQRAWWLGYAQGTRDQSTDGTVAQFPVRR